jgi:hypothetical protein
MDVYLILGKLFFRRQQVWEQRKNAKIMVWTVVLAVGLAVTLAIVIKVLNTTRHSG